MVEVLFTRTSQQTRHIDIILDMHEVVKETVTAADPLHTGRARNSITQVMSTRAASTLCVEAERWVR